MANRKFRKAIFFLVLIVLGSCTLNAQVKNEEADKKVIEELRAAFVMEKMLKDKHYIFKAQTVSTSSVGQRLLVPNQYDIQIKNDSVTVSLPYFGQSFSAQTNRIDGDGLKLTSTKFDYSAVESKNGKWLISIKPKDSREVQLLYLTVFTNGSTMLQVTSTNRESMTYNGYVMTL